MSLTERATSSEVRASYYRYNPSLAPAIVAAVLYTIAFLLSLVQWVRYRAWIWAIMVVAAASKLIFRQPCQKKDKKKKLEERRILTRGLVEAAGWISRCISVKDVTDKPSYSVQFGLVILAPVLMAGCCYIIFSRILFLIVPREQRTFKLCWVPPRFITPIFVGFDIVALLLQMGGAIMITSVDGMDKNARDKLNTGKHVAQIGVIVQLVAFGLFAVAAVRFNFTSKRFTRLVSERYESSGEKEHIIGGVAKNKHWPSLLRVVNFTTILILVSFPWTIRSSLALAHARFFQVRSVYRLVEFTQGTTGYLNTHEWPLYIFDALCIYPCVALFVYWHPSRYLPYMGLRLPKEAR